MSGLPWVDALAPIHLSFWKSLFIWLHCVLVVTHGLSCPTVPGILVPWPGIKPASLALARRFLTAGPPGKSPILISSVVMDVLRNVPASSGETWASRSQIYVPWVWPWLREAKPQPGRTIKQALLEGSEIGKRMTTSRTFKIALPLTYH